MQDELASLDGFPGDPDSEDDKAYYLNTFHAVYLFLV